MGTTLLQTIFGHLNSALDNQDLPRPQVLEGMSKLPGDLSSNASGNGPTDWLNALEGISQQVRESLLVRALQVHVPRLAEAMVRPPCWPLLRTDRQLQTWTGAEGLPG